VRITRAGDDAAGLGISSKLEAHIRSFNQAARNSSDGLSMVQTAEAALGEQATLLTRLRELAMQAASDGLSDADRGKVNDEAQALVAELDRIAQANEYDGTKLLDGSVALLGIQVGIQGTRNDVISFATLDATTAGPGAAFAVAAFTSAANDAFAATPHPGLFDPATAAANATAAATAAGANPAVAAYAALAAKDIFGAAYASAGGDAALPASAAGPALTAGLALVNATSHGGTGSSTLPGAARLATAYQAFAAALVANGGDLLNAYNAVVPSGTTGANLWAGSAALNTFLATFAARGGDPNARSLKMGTPAAKAGLAALGYVGVGSGSAGGLAIAGLALSTRAAAVTALGTLDDALGRVSSARAEVGAAGNRLESALGSIQSASEALSAAFSRIKDVDVAEETSRLARYRILASAGISVLAQANQVRQLALKLLEYVAPSPKP
jgi:flagellin